MITTNQSIFPLWFPYRPLCVSPINSRDSPIPPRRHQQCLQREIFNDVGDVYLHMWGGIRGIGEGCRTKEQRQPCPRVQLSNVGRREADKAGYGLLQQLSFFITTRKDHDRFIRV